MGQTRSNFCGLWRSFRDERSNKFLSRVIGNEICEIKVTPSLQVNKGRLRSFKIMNSSKILFGPIILERLLKYIDMFQD